MYKMGFILVCIHGIFLCSFSSVLSVSIWHAHVTEVLYGPEVSAVFVHRICMIQNNYWAIKEKAVNETTKKLRCQRYFGTILWKSSYHIHFLATFLTYLMWSEKCNLSAIKTRRYLTWLEIAIALLSMDKGK